MLIIFAPPNMAEPIWLYGRVGVYVPVFISIHNMLSRQQYMPGLVMHFEIAHYENHYDYYYLKIIICRCHGMVVVVCGKWSWGLNDGWYAVCVPYTLTELTHIYISDVYERMKHDYKYLLSWFGIGALHFM